MAYSPNDQGRPPDNGRKGILFRRFRRDHRTGKVLDAHDYGLAAWPIRLSDPTRRRKKKPR